VDVADLAARIQRLEDLEAIRKLTHQTWMYYDNQDIEELVDLFTDDFTSTAGAPLFLELVGKAAVREALVKDFASALSVHVGSGAVIELTSDTTATGYWSIDELYYYADRGSEWHAKGPYRSEYVKIDGDWKVKSLAVTFQFRESIERSR
jgi:hypothetical protein